MSKNNNIDYRHLTINEIEMELKRENYKSRYKKILASTIYILVIISALSALVATLVMPILQISGSSMSPTFGEGEIVVALKVKKMDIGEVIAFYHGNKILVKRVIANAGSYVNIDEEGKVYVDGKLLNEKFENINITEVDIELPYQVPDGHYFVLGDNRKESIDSKNSEIGSISQDDVIGKIVFRIWPLKK